MDIDTQGIFTYITITVVPLLFLAAGVVILLGFKKGNLKEAMGIVMVLLLGAIVVAGAFTWYTFGETLSGVITN